MSRRDRAITKDRDIHEPWWYRDATWEYLTNEEKLIAQKMIEDGKLSKTERGRLIVIGEKK